MDKKKLVKDLQDCIYRRDEQDRVSVAKLKLVINRIAGEHIYNDNETKIYEKK